MDNYKEMHELCETLTGEVKEMNAKIRAAGGKMSPQDLENVDRLTHALKSIKATMAMDEEDEGYSEYYPMDGGSSYRRRRDGMGRYSRYPGYPGWTGSPGIPRYPNRNYSRNDLVDKIRQLMDNAPDDRTRQDIQRMVERMENNN